MRDFYALVADDARGDKLSVPPPLASLSTTHLSPADILRLQYRRTCRPDDWTRPARAPARQDAPHRLGVPDRNRPVPRPSRSTRSVQPHHHPFTDLLTLIPDPPVAVGRKQNTRAKRPGIASSRCGNGSKPRSRNAPAGSSTTPSPRPSRSCPTAKRAKSPSPLSCGGVGGPKNRA